MQTPHEPSRPLIALPALLVAALGSQGGCADDSAITWRSYPIAAHCSVNVIGKGSREVETDYLPNVVACENGNADFEALKAQAVAARSYAYYKIQDSGQIKDGTGDQVYSCDHATAEQKHRDAVAATAGQVLTYHGDVIAAFYVAGAKPTTPDCVAAPADPDPTSTEKYVTYNEGKAGAAITQTSLGWIHPENWANRGCKSQNGAHCLSLRGRPYDEILRFYYGSDIGLETAVGPCVVPPPPDAGLPPPDAGAPPPPADAGPGIDSGGSCLPAQCAQVGGSCCGGRCVSLQADPFNCGACGVVCAAGERCLGDPATGLGSCQAGDAAGGCALASTPQNHPSGLPLALAGLALLLCFGRRRRR